MEQCPNNIRILTNSEGIVEFKSSRLAKDDFNEYPGYNVFSQGRASSPLSAHEFLLGRQFYYLLSFQNEQKLCDPNVITQVRNMGLPPNKVDMEWINEIEPPKMLYSTAALDHAEDVSNGQALEVRPRLGDGVWRVKLVINTKQMEEIVWTSKYRSLD